jgi:hypothetical protein
MCVADCPVTHPTMASWFGLSGLEQRRQPLPRLALFRLSAAGVRAAVFVSNTSVAVSDTPRNNPGHATIVRAWPMSLSRTDPRMFLPVCLQSGLSAATQQTA